MLKHVKIVYFLLPHKMIINLRRNEEQQEFVGAIL